MQEILDEEEHNHSSSQLSEIAIFKKIWLSPRESFKFINENNHHYYANILLVLNGIALTFNTAITAYIYSGIPLWAILLFCIVPSGILSLGVCYLLSVITNWVGKELSAEGNVRALVGVYAYAAIPFIVSAFIHFVLLLIYFLLAFIYGQETFSLMMSKHYKISQYITNIVLFIDLILYSWVFFLFFIGTTEVQKLSTPRTVLNFVVSFIIFSIPMFFLIITLKSFSS